MIESLRNLEFASPYVLAILPLALALGWWGARARRRSVIRYSWVPLVEPAGRTWRTRLAWLPPALRTAAMVLLVVAAARPRIGQGEVRTTAQGVAIMMVVDRSLSMELPMNYDREQLERLEVVKRVFQEFVEGNDAGLEGRPEDLIGLVTFAGFAETICPLVRVHTTLIDLVRGVDLARDRVEGGTAIGDGLALAAARLQQAEKELIARNEGEIDPEFTIKSKAIVLLTDGDENQGQISSLQAARLCQEWGIKIYAIGIGDERGGRVRASRGLVPIRPGQGFNESLLKRVAELTGGNYWRARSGESLREIYERIDELETTEITSVEFTSYNEAFAPWAMAGLVLLGLDALLGLTFLRRAS